MVTEEKLSRPYTVEEILSFDRIRRAMTSRVLDRIENLWQGRQPVAPEQITEVTSDEWEKVKETVRSSPAAREAFRKYLERTVSDEIDKVIRKDKTELGLLGVLEKGL
jgi:hypothetical protein